MGRWIFEPRNTLNLRNQSDETELGLWDFFWEVYSLVSPCCGLGAAGVEGLAEDPFFDGVAVAGDVADDAVVRMLE